MGILESYGHIPSCCRSFSMKVLFITGVESNPLRSPQIVPKGDTFAVGEFLFEKFMMHAGCKHGKVDQKSAPMY